MRLTIQADGTTFTLDDVFTEAKSGQHVNSMPFAGIVTLVDSPSNSAPHGAEGHRILMPKASALKRVKTLIGQGVNYKPDLTGHAAQRKVGVITHAWLEGNAVKVKGIIWKRDFPEAEKVLKGQRLGMSMELANVRVNNPSADVWHLDDFTFTGATILHNQNAAYHRTALAASKDQRILNRKSAKAAKAALGHGGSTMPEKKKKAASSNDVQILASAIGTQVSQSLNDVLTKFGKSLVGSINSMKEEIVNNLEASREDPEDEATKKLEALLAAGKRDDDDDDMDAAKRKAKKDDDDDDSDDDDDDDVDAKKDDDTDDDMDAKKDDDDDDDMDAKKDDDDDDDMDASLESMSKTGDPDNDGDDPGHLNKNARSHGNKTTVTKNTLDAGKKGMTTFTQPNKMKMKIRKGLESGRVVHAMAAASEHITTLYAQQDKMQRTIAKQNKLISRQTNLIRKMEAQADRFAQKIDRQSLPPEASALLAKAGYSAASLQADGTKLSVAVVDQIFAEAAPTLNPRERIHFKNLLLQNGLMEDGVIDRGFRAN